MQRSSLPFGAAPWAAFFLLTAAACSSSEPSAAPSATTGDGGAVDAAPAATVTQSDLGRTCAAGCAGVDVCTVANADCQSGQCLFDKAHAEAYCTADCSSASCPAGFACRDVPFALKRACMRDSTVVPGGPRVKGSVSVTGSVGAHDASPVPYADTSAIDTAPAAKLTAECGAVYLTTGGTRSTASTPAVPGFLMYVTVCGAAKSWISLQLPFTTGTFTSGFPDLKANVARRVNGSGLNYDEGNASVQVTAAEEIDASADPYRAKRLVVRFDGTVPQDTSSCGPAASCDSGSPSVTISGELELTNVVSAP